MDYGLRGKVALVTGAASGIGRATVDRLTELGAHVVAADIDDSADLGDVRFVHADVAEEGALETAVEEVMSAFGRLDCAANCAGVGGGHASTHEYPVETWDGIVAINLRGTWLSMRAEIPAMLAGGTEGPGGAGSTGGGGGTGGAIVNVASTLGLRGSPFGSPYSASKHGVLGLTKTAAIEYAQQGIRVNAVCPGAIDTPMMDETFERFPGFREMLTGFVPMGRMGSPAEVAAAIAWLCSDAASFITGEGLTIEGGLLAR
jgi:NAD(P)-dependent dehydrogenase (short-subunit alcohol dehydrogenase family)